MLGVKQAFKSQGVSGSALMVMKNRMNMNSSLRVMEPIGSLFGPRKLT
jgi:hypothetical protein